MAHSNPIPPDAAVRITELAPEARLARRQHSEDDIKVRSSKELTSLFKKLHNDGCSIPAIAKAAGMTYHSVSARIKKTDD